MGMGMGMLYDRFALMRRFGRGEMGIMLASVFEGYIHNIPAYKSNGHLQLWNWFVVVFRTMDGRGDCV